MITFYYDIDKLLDNVRVKSDYRTSTEIDRGEEKLIPSVNVADNPIAERLLDDAGGELALLMSGYADGLTDEDGNELEAYEFGIEYDDPVNLETLTNAMVFRLNMPDTFNTKNKTGLDRTIKNAIEQYVLWKYNEMVNFDFRLYEAAYKRETDKLLLYLNKRTETIQRAYKLF